MIMRLVLWQQSIHVDCVSFTAPPVRSTTLSESPTGYRCQHALPVDIVFDQSAWCHDVDSDLYSGLRGASVA